MKEGYNPLEVTPAEHLKMYLDALLETIAEHLAKIESVEAKLDQLLEAKKPKPRKRSSEVKYPAEFEDVWSEYPKRLGSNPKKRALQAWFARGDAATFGDGDTELLCNAEKFRMLMGAVAYCKFCDATGKTGTEFVMQAATFFGPDKHYENDWTVPDQAEKMPDDEHLLAWAIGKGFRGRFPGETYPQYRQALEGMTR